MKKHALWLVPGLIAAAALGAMPACSSSNDPVDPGAPDSDSGMPGRDSSTDPTDSSTEDARTGDARADANQGDSGEAGAIDPYVEACARIDACATATAPKIGMNGCYALLTLAPFARQLHAPARVALEDLKCKMAATTCAGVRACSRPNADYVAFCQQQEEGIQDHCDGNVHVVCDGDPLAPILAVDCAATGGVCGEQGGYAGCGLAPCTQGETLSTCNGKILTECSSANVTLAVDCATAADAIPQKPAGYTTIAGATCGQPDPVEAPDFRTCVGDGVACNGLSQRCDGKVLETCARGKISRRDCSTLLPAGQGCGPLPEGPMAGALSCVPVTPVCNETDNETCNTANGVIGFCALTEAKTVDCKALGYAGCKTTTVAGRVTAACFQ